MKPERRYVPKCNPVLRKGSERWGVYVTVREGHAENSGGYYRTRKEAKEVADELNAEAHG